MDSKRIISARQHSPRSGGPNAKSHRDFRFIFWPNVGNMINGKNWKSNGSMWLRVDPPQCASHMVTYRHRQRHLSIAIVTGIYSCRRRSRRNMRKQRQLRAPRVDEPPGKKQWRPHSIPACVTYFHTSVVSIGYDPTKKKGLKLFPRV